MIKLLTVIGARPQIIKAAALSRSIRINFPTKIKEVIVHTGQHYDQNMSDIFFVELEIPKPDYNLGIGSGKHGEQTARMIIGLEEVILKENPDYLILYGDTNSTLSGAIAASKIHVPIIHIEAGLRSFNKSMPEEINRIVCDHCSTYLFTPTDTGFNNLLKEGFKLNSPPFTINNPGIFNFGDIMYDNSIFFAELAEQKSSIINKLNLQKNEFLLATVHRDYNTDKPDALKEIIKSFDYLSESNNIKIIFPIHPRTLRIIQSFKNRKDVKKFLKNPLIQIVEPVSFLDMIQLEKFARLILTDSGGVQKEAYFFNKPCIILRTETEWIEVLDTGNAELTGANFKLIINAFNRLTDKPKKYFPKIFGNGQASKYILQTLLDK